MEVEKRKLTDYIVKKSVGIVMNRDNIINHGFEPGTSVNVVFEKDKITIVKEIKSVGI